MKNKIVQRMGSYFLSIPGLVVLVVILVLGFYFDAPLICGFVLLFFLICLIAYLWSQSVARHLRADTADLRGAVFPGEEIVLEVCIENTGVLAAIWAEVYLPIGNKSLFEPQNCDYGKLKLQDPQMEMDGICQKFAWIGKNQILKCQLELTAKKRSVTVFESIYTKTGDGFGVATVLCKNRPSSGCEVYVYPRLYPVHVDKLQKKGSTFHPGKGDLYQDVTLLRNIRAYQPTDTAKNINWRMLAKQQRLSVNLYENIRPQSIVFLLDLQSFSYEKKLPESEANQLIHRVWEDDMELAISFVASAIIELAQEGCMCGLVIPGYGEIEPEILYKENSSFFLEEYLRMLARISYTGGGAFWPEIQLERLSSGWGKIYIVTQTEPDKRLAVYDFYESATAISNYFSGRSGSLALSEVMDYENTVSAGVEFSNVTDCETTPRGGVHLSDVANYEKTDRRERNANTK